MEIILWEIISINEIYLRFLSLLLRQPLVARCSQLMKRMKGYKLSHLQYSKYCVLLLLN